MKVSHKKFAHELATNCDILTGNVVSNCQHSAFIRSGRYPEKQAFDLGAFPEASEWIKAKVRDYLRRDDGALYFIRHYNGKRRVIHGVIVTRNCGMESLRLFERLNVKSQEILTYAERRLFEGALWSNALRARHCHERTMLALLADTTPKGELNAQI